MSLFRLIMKLGVDSTELDTGLKKAESGIESWSKRIGGYLAGAFTAAAVSQLINDVKRLAGEIKDVAEQYDLTYEQVQRLQRLSANSGVGLEKYLTALGKIKKAQADFSAGDPTAKTLFEKLGVDPKLGSFDILQQLGFSQDKAAVFEVLGVKSASMFNSLKQINDLGPILLITDDQVERLDKAEKSMANFKADAMAYAALKIGGAYEKYDQNQKGRGGIMGALGGVDAILQTVLDYIGDAFGSGGRNVNKNMGRADLAEALAKRGQKTTPGVEIEQLPATAEGPRFPLLERLVTPRKFSAINIGDRSNVGGFFGPNADLNSKLNKVATDVSAIAKGLDAIAKVVVSAGQDKP